MPSSFRALSPSLPRAALSVLALALSAGCSLPAQHPPEPAMVVNPASPATAAVPAVLTGRDQVTPLLAYADRARALRGAELAQEITRLGDPAQPVDQIRLAIALSQTRQLYDLVRAQDLLQRVLANPGDDVLPLHTLARLLAARFAEQRRVEDQLDRQNQQVRDLQRRLGQTQEKLDALREIERSLSKRAPAAAAPPPHGRARPPAP